MFDDRFQFQKERLDRLRDQTLVNEIEYWPEIGSTNTRGIERCRNETISQPVLIVAERQTAGRGRGRNQWWAAPGALTFSLILPESLIELPIEHIPKLSLTLGLAISECLSGLNPSLKAKVKWPNDVLIDNRKVCGMLVEVPQLETSDSINLRTRDQDSRVFVAGIGLNVNNSLQPAPAEIRSMATSLLDSSGETFNLQQVLQSVLESIGKWIDRLSRHPQSILDEWPAYCALTGQTVAIQLVDRDVSGTCVGIDQHGGLLLNTGDQVESFYGGVIGSSTLTRHLEKR